MKFYRRYGTRVVFYDTDSRITVEFSQNEVTFITAWGGVGCAVNCIEFTNSLHVGLLGLYAPVVLFNRITCNITGSYDQVHDNDEGAGKKNPFTKKDMQFWKERVTKMLAVTPVWSILVRFILRRALSALDMALT